MDSLGRDSAESGSKDAAFPGGGLKPNQVGETVLYGIPIVSLVIDGQERLCLAQISNTLLKNYSYNEIHNRRVALGITCVQCTPVQLEILRRAGAMPISSRRCGMITKREAERLCKSFLGAHSPPKLPENFAFDVSHECAWGSRGSFIPARYNSSRAKCIKCCYCNMYFSPNKFIFHSHRTPDAKYTQPDAANFNSWRRHLKLTDKNSPTDVAHAWEDVKAMFNGGSRKRTLPSSCSEAPLKPAPRGSPETPAKILSCEENRGGTSARSYPVIPVPSKGFGVLQKIPPPLFPSPYGFPTFGLCPKKDEGLERPGLPGVLWHGASKDTYPPFPMFWPLPPYPPPHGHPHGHVDVDVDVEHCSDRSTNTSKDSALIENDRCSSTQSLRNEDEKSADEARPTEGSVTSLVPRKLSYVSAFRPVIKDTDCIARLYGPRGACRPGYMSPDFLSESSSFRSASPCVDSEGEADVDVETHKGAEHEEPMLVPSGCPNTRPGSRAPEHKLDLIPHEAPGAEAPGTEAHRNLPPQSHALAASFTEVYPAERAETQQRSGQYQAKEYSPALLCSAHDEGVRKEEPSSTVEEIDSKCFHDHSGDETQRERDEGEDPDRAGPAQRDLQSLAKEELQKQLLEQVELRKKLEREFQNLKENFQDQMKRELSYREEMVQQLHIVREAHDALHHFSCKMLTPRHCAGSCTFKSPLMPP
ncbi:SKI family transcriptional corepressor 1 homolog-B [Periophthalmus magnuspinnatus]|uniref:SKI family transcriptional corepressor 1 homolog-B n=1 Tax=Periophthalmus magnuspinnatus TaxID=409849 RepID=UPI00145BBF90|nr:SKI family transcriptional corepressor 1 homolog-B [Periophthalmus magnuspinnatus]